MSAIFPASLPGQRPHDPSRPTNANAGNPVALVDHAASTSAGPNAGPNAGQNAGPFSAADLEQFRTEDAAAGRTICTILTTLFTVCVLLATGVIIWTFLFAISPH